MNAATWKSVGAVVLIGLAGSLSAEPVSPNPEPQTASDITSALRTVQRMVAVWTDQGAPQPDLTWAIIGDGGNVITGGPLMYGNALAAICDITGPDMRDIIRLVENGKFTFPGRPMVAKFVHPDAPPLPLGTHASGGKSQDIMATDLWPAAVWLLRSSTSDFHSGELANLSSIPEPASASLLAIGALILRRFKR